VTGVQTCALPISISAQTDSTYKCKYQNRLKTSEANPEKKDTVFFEIPEKYKNDFIEFEEFPEFPGGEIELKNFIIEKTVYPQSAIKDSIEGKVFMRFAIDIDGCPTDVQVIRGIRSDLDNESIRVLKEMPGWKPGSTVFRAKKGLYRAKAKMWYSVPFTYTFSNEQPKWGIGIIIKPK
jgi:TonB family protein